MTEEKKMSNNKEQKNKTWQAIMIVVLAIVALAGGYFWGRNMVLPIDKTKNVEVEKDITRDWEIFKSEKYGFSFKYPKDMNIADLTVAGSKKKDPLLMYTISRKDSDSSDIVSIKVNSSRSIGAENADNSLQVSMPFDKKNYVIFSTSTSNKDKKEFYNILGTLEFGVK